MYYEINEGLAKQAQTMNSFRDYVPGSATAEYRAAVDEAAELAERQKKKVSEYYHRAINSLLDSYSRRLAKWYNDYNRNRASCSSIMISGGSNFPVRKKEKQNAREETLFREYEEIKGILDRIRSVGTGAIDFADPHAREILQDRLDRLLEYQADAKKINAYFRRHKTVIGCPALSETEAQKIQADFEHANAAYCLHDVPFPSYELTSIRGKIKRVQERLKQLDKLQETPQEAIDFDGGQIVRNVDINRVQIFFDEKPDPGLRDNLKIHGFHWSPKQGAWQRQLTDNAMRAAKAALGI